MDESQTAQSGCADILEFAKGRKPNRPSCWVCSLPERAAIDEAHRLGATSTDIQQYLITKKGYPVAEARQRRVKNHFDSRHHLGE